MCELRESGVRDTGLLLLGRPAKSASTAVFEACASIQLIEQLLDMNDRDLFEPSCSVAAIDIRSNPNLIRRDGHADQP